ncbi:MAG: peptidase T [Deltaproteobacteria bacterium]|nr:peptidase T [Deltaproteobacteria bacterium]
MKGRDDLLLREARERFLRYVRVDTRSDPESGAHPSSDGQWDLAGLLAEELDVLGLEGVEVDGGCYLYARLPAAGGVEAPALCLCAHLDTSPSESGEGVTPLLHEQYQGGPIHFPDDPELILNPELSPELNACIGHTIITASGRTLLGADDKAGIAEIMAALSAFRRFDELPHPELRIVFTPDEEIGQGTRGIDLERLAPVGYTVDGGDMGVIEEECFTAHEVRVLFTGRNVHPGYAKDRMINAGAAAARFAASLPEHDTPEHAEDREGFSHLTGLEGQENEARLTYILRDFDEENNRKRVALLEGLAGLFQRRYPGLIVRVDVLEQYRNMKEALALHPDVVARAERAVKAVGLQPVKKPIRGGTDGARLSFMGMPCPNLFSGAMLPHSRTEWVSETVMQKASETIVRLCGLWCSG